MKTAVYEEPATLIDEESCARDRPQILCKPTFHLIKIKDSKKIHIRYVGVGGVR